MSSANSTSHELDANEVGGDSPLDRLIISKLILSILIPTVALLALFGYILYQLKSDLFLREVANRGHVVSYMAMGLDSVEQSIKADIILNDDQLYASALESVDALVFHDSAGQVITSPFQKMPHIKQLSDIWLNKILDTDYSTKGKKSGVLMHGHKMYLWTSLQHPLEEYWTSTLVPCDHNHAVLSTIGTARFLAIVLAVLWLSGWSAYFVIKKYLARVSDTARQLEYKNMHDDLTGLPNRLMTNQIIQTKSRELLTEKDNLLVVVIDLIGFRDINDTLGHNYGDRLLKSVGAELQKLNSEDIVTTHLGSDVFCLICCTSNDLTEVYATVNQVHDIMDNLNELDGTPIAVQCRMGISSFPADTDNAGDLIRLSDIALAQSKNSKQKMSSYKREKDSHTIRKLSLLARLRSAIEEDELQLVYQPKVNVQTGEFIGVEALVRWTDSEFGPVSPVEFVSWAEKSGLVDKLTQWVLETAGTQSSVWQKLGYKIPIAVNLSPINFQDQDLPINIEQLIDEGQFSGGLLELEITENAVMSDPVVARNCMKKLHDLGVPFAIDDFGTGLSSFTYLRKFPVSNLKIDKEFVMGEGGQERDGILLRSMIELGHNLGCVVTAEGVEDEQAVDRLRAFGCDIVQGYHICRPIHPDELLNWLHTENWSMPKQVA